MEKSQIIMTVTNKSQSQRDEINSGIYYLYFVSYLQIYINTNIHSEVNSQISEDGKCV